jgi:hypothetical protein
MTVQTAKDATAYHTKTQYVQGDTKAWHIAGKGDLSKVLLNLVYVYLFSALF